MAADGDRSDFVIVGSGAGGGPLAANLAEAGFSVLLLEAGDDHRCPYYDVPVFHARASEDAGSPGPPAIRPVARSACAATSSAWPTPIPAPAPCACARATRATPRAPVGLPFDPAPAGSRER
jgi:choline dehydrogenase-like flavoprotein